MILIAQNCYPSLHLWIWKSEDVGQQGVSTPYLSISHIRIDTCPLLTKRLQRKKGKEWRNIARTPFIEIIEPNTSTKANQVFVLLAPLLILLAFFLIYLLGFFFFSYKLSIN